MPRDFQSFGAVVWNHRSTEENSSQAVEGPTALKRGALADVGAFDGPAAPSAGSSPTNAGRVAAGQQEQLLKLSGWGSGMATDDGLDRT